MDIETKEIEKIEDYYKVSKSNALIDSVYSLTALEQKVLISVISILNSKEQENFYKYRVSITTLREILGIKRANFYTDLKQMTMSILSKPFKYKDKEANTTLQAPWFASCEYIDGEGIVEFEFSPKVKKLLLNLKNEYTSYMLGYAVQLKSKYSIRIYELLKRIESMKTATFYLIELRDMVGVNKQYPKYAQFKQNVLEVSKKEINQYTDIKFSYKELKSGRKVENIKFIVKSNIKNIKPSTEKDMFDDTETTLLLKHLGVSTNKVNEIVKDYKDEYIRDRIERYEYELTYNKEKIKEIGTGKYLYNIITHSEWKNEKFEAHKKELKEKKLRREAKEEKERINNLKNEYKEYIKSIAKPYEDIDEEQKRSIDKRIEEEIQDYKNNKFITQETLLKIIEGYREQFIIEKLEKEIPFIEWELQR